MTRKVNFSFDLPEIERTDLEVTSSRFYELPPHIWRVWDNFDAVLPDPPVGADDLGINGGTFATATPAIETHDVKTTSSTSYARALFTLPPEYITAGAATITAHAGVTGAVASSSMTMDFKAYIMNNEGGITVPTDATNDIVRTAAQSINNLTLATKTYTVYVVDLGPGSRLDIRMALTWVDANAVTMTGIVGKVGLNLDIRG